MHVLHVGRLHVLLEAHIVNVAFRNGSAWAWASESWGGQQRLCSSWSISSTFVGIWGLSGRYSHRLVDYTWSYGVDGHRTERWKLGREQVMRRPIA